MLDKHCDLLWSAPHSKILLPAITEIPPIFIRVDSAAMADHHRTRNLDPFLVSYTAEDLQIASEFLSNWLPFLSRGLCNRCTQTLSDRILSLDSEIDGNVEPFKQDESFTASTPDDKNCNGYDNDCHESCDTNSLGSWKDGANGCSEPISDGLRGHQGGSRVHVESSSRERTLRVDMAQEEDELQKEEVDDVGRQLVNGNVVQGEVVSVQKGKPKRELSREQREYIRFNNVRAKKDFICFERVKGKLVNILDGLELHMGVFSAAEQKRIVDFVYELEEMGKRGELKERTYTATQKWMRGKGSVTIQFGCCYNYATDRQGNPPGILHNEVVDPIPQLFKVMIKRLVRWHVMPPTCVPDSCIVNMYDEGDCIPPHIDNHDFVRPFCTVSFLSECNIVFGLNLKIVGAGEFAGAWAIPLPVGSVLVLKGNGADVAKHCVPAVRTKRISITFRRMDETKWPNGYVPESDLQGLQPLLYKEERSKSLIPSRPKHLVNRQMVEREDSTGRTRGLLGRGPQPHSFGQIHRAPANRQRARLNLDD